MSGVQRRLDEVEHVFAHLVNVVARPLSGRADSARCVIRRFVVGFGEPDPHRDAPRAIQEPVQAAGFRPGRHFSGVPARGIHIALRRRQDPEVGEQLVAPQLAALDLLSHVQAGRSDLLGLRPVSGGDQVQHDHAPALDGIDGCAVLAELFVGPLKRSAEIGHDAEAIRRKRQQHHALRRHLRQQLHGPGQHRTDGVGGGGDVLDAGPVHQDRRVQSRLQGEQGGVGLLPVPGAAGIVGDRHK